MNILVIGGGGREHALIWKLAQSRRVDHIWCAPGNGGIAALAECVPLKATDIAGIVEFARAHRPDLVLVAPDDPLALGLVDELEAIGVRAFGPHKNAAIIEASKSFAKDLMRKYRIPTAEYAVFDDAASARASIEEKGAPIVIKADGLALGKGVIIAMTREEAIEGIKTIMAEHKFGHSGDQIVIEEYLEGPEVSVLSFTDGNVVVPMISSMDHKRANDNDEGLNTGGMGTIAPNPYYTKEIAEVCMETIFKPTIEAMKSEGRTFRGCLYFGLMLTKDGPKVIEYNCRFGDPEAQVVLPLLDSDLLTIMQAVTEGRLADVEVKWKDESACCIIEASGGYPVAYESGFEITGVDQVDNVYVAGADLRDGKLYTHGGRVLGVVETAPTLKEAIDKAYASAAKVSFEKMHMRKDIGQRALKALN